jgi:hypothetical protein
MGILKLQAGSSLAHLEPELLELSQPSHDAEPANMAQTVFH